MFASAVAWTTGESNSLTSGLKVLLLNACIDAGDQVLVELARACPNVQVLALSREAPFSLNASKIVTPGQAISETGLSAVLKRCKNLRVLDLAGLQESVKLCWDHICALSKLEVLNVSSCPRITQLDLDHLLESVPLQVFIGDVFSPKVSCIEKAVWEEWSLVTPEKKVIVTC
jgi:hypothetical protein